MAAGVDTEVGEQAGSLDVLYAAAAAATPAPDSAPANGGGGGGDSNGGGGSTGGSGGPEPQGTQLASHFDLVLSLGWL